MSKTRIREIGRFEARAASGQRVVVQVFAQETETSTLADTHDRWTETGQQYRLPDGTPINADAMGQLTNARTGEALTRL